MSKAKARLHFDDTRSKAGSAWPADLAEVGVLNIAMNCVPITATAIQIQPVEEVIEIGAHLNFSVLADQLHVWQTERLAKGRVDVEVARPPERISGNSWPARQWPQRLLPARACSRIR